MKPFSEASYGDCKITVYLGSRLRRPGFVIDFYDGKRKTRYPRWPEALGFRGVCEAPGRLMEGKVSEEGTEFLNDLKGKWGEVASCSENHGFFEMLREGNDAYKILQEDENILSENEGLKKALRKIQDEIGTYKQENKDLRKMLTLKSAGHMLAGKDRNLAEGYVRFLKRCVEIPESKKEPGKKYGPPDDHHDLKGINVTDFFRKISRKKYVDDIKKNRIVGSIKKTTVNRSGKKSVSISIPSKDGKGMKFIVRTTAEDDFQMIYVISDLKEKMGLND